MDVTLIIPLPCLEPSGSFPWHSEKAQTPHMITRAIVNLPHLANSVVPTLQQRCYSNTHRVCSAPAISSVWNIPSLALCEAGSFPHSGLSSAAVRDAPSSSCPRRPSFHLCLTCLNSATSEMILFPCACSLFVSLSQMRMFVHFVQILGPVLRIVLASNQA